MKKVKIHTWWGDEDSMSVYFRPSKEGIFSNNGPYNIIKLAKIAGSDAVEVTEYVQKHKPKTYCLGLPHPMADKNYWIDCGLWEEITKDQFLIELQYV